MKLAIDRLLSLQALAFVAQGKDSADAATIGSAIARLEPLKNTYTLPDTLWPSADKIMSDAAPVVDPSGPTNTVPLDSPVVATPAEQVTESPAPVAPAEPVPAPVPEALAPVADASPAQPEAPAAEPVDVDPTPPDKETIASLDARVDAIEKANRK